MKKTSWFATMLKLAKKLCMLHKFDTDTGPSLVAYHPGGRFWHSSWELIGCKKTAGCSSCYLFLEVHVTKLFNHILNDSCNIVTKHNKERSGWHFNDDCLQV